jgi:excisionase family DNA binding protein
MAVCDCCGAEREFVCTYEGRNPGVPGSTGKPNVGQVHEKAKKAGFTLIKGVLRCHACAVKHKADTRQKAQTRQKGQTPPHAPDTLTIEEVARIDRCSTKTVRRAIEQGLLKVSRVGPGSRLIRILPGDLEAYHLNVQPEKEQPMESTPANVQGIRQPTREEKRQIIGMLDAAYDTAAGRYVGGETDKTIAESLGGGVMPGWVAEIREELFGPEGGNDELAALVAEHAAALVRLAAWSNDFGAQREAFARLERDGAAIATLLRDLGPRIEKLKRAIGPKATSA